MLDFTNCNIKETIAHYVGNQTNDEELIISQSLIDLNDFKLKELLIKYFLYPFRDKEDFFSLSFADNDFNLNPLYQIANSIFINKTDFQTKSISIAKYLFELSIHPQIKSGDLFIVYIDNINFNGDLVDGLGIFKIENKQEFLQLNRDSKDFFLKYEDGFNIEKLDKGCLILNCMKDDGNRVLIVDKSGRTNDAYYWTEKFINAKPTNTEFQQTSQFLGITKHFVTKQLDDDFGMSKADKIDLLNRSVEYFKKNEVFDKKEFEEEVFKENSVIESFRKFDQEYRQEKDLDSFDNFQISTQAVKKQTKIFKNVLKLDRNFDIYIHGDKELIQKGIEKDGRKYYKLYYEEEK